MVVKSYIKLFLFARHIALLFKYSRKYIWRGYICNLAGEQTVNFQSDNAFKSCGWYNSFLQKRLFICEKHGLQ